MSGVAQPETVTAIARAVSTLRDQAPPAASPTTSGSLNAVADEAALPSQVVEVVARDVARHQPETPEVDVPDDSPEADEEMYAPLDLRVTVEAVRAHLDTGIKGSNHMEAAIKQIAWEPDFFILNHRIDKWSGDLVKGGEIYRVPKRFLPERMAPGLRKLARLWAELCRFVLIQLGSTRSFGVGWVFSEDTMACHFRAENEPWLLLNPFVHGRMKRKRSSEPAHVYSASDLDDLDLLYALAIHECTHLAGSISRHDEAFASALTLNIARTYGRSKQVRAIRAAVVSRKFTPGKLRGRRSDE